MRGNVKVPLLVHHAGASYALILHLGSATAHRCSEMSRRHGCVGTMSGWLAGGRMGPSILVAASSDVMSTIVPSYTTTSLPPDRQQACAENGTHLSKDLAYTLLCL